jgi:hypothetical protein
MAVSLGEDMTVHLPTKRIKTLTDWVLRLALDVGAELGIGFGESLDVP